MRFYLQKWQQKENERFGYLYDAAISYQNWNNICKKEIVAIIQHWTFIYKQKRISKSNMRVSFHRADRSPLPDQSVYVLQNTSHQLSQTRFRSYCHTTRYVCYKSIVVYQLHMDSNFIRQSSHLLYFLGIFSKCP